MFKLTIRKIPTIILSTLLLVTCTILASSNTIQNDAKLISTIVNNSHYSKDTIDNTKFINTYIDKLDSGYHFILQSEVDTIVKNNPKASENLTKGNIALSYHIYSLLKEKVNTRNAFQLKYLNSITEIPNSNKKYSKIKERLNTKQELEERWKDDIDYQILYTLASTKMTFEEAKDDIKTLLEFQTKRLTSIPKDEIYELYLNSWTQQRDPHSTYFSSSSLQDFIDGLKQSLIGIGVLLTDNRGIPTIKEVIENSPASKDNRIIEETKILKVDDVDVRGMRLKDIVKLVRGVENTEVTLVLESPKEGQFTTTLTRHKVQTQHSGTNGSIFHSDTGKYGVIEVNTFYRDIPQAISTTLEVRRILDRFEEENIDGLIIDLRNNSGGMLTEAVSLTSLFTDQPFILQLANAKGDSQKIARSPGVALYKGPLFILISEQSASASEIFAGALQYYNRALIIGDNSSYGKGTVQQLIQISSLLSRFNLTNKNNGGVKVTTQAYYLPSGLSIQGVGVKSDLELLRPYFKEVNREENLLTVKKLKPLVTTEEKDKYLINNSIIESLSEYYNTLKTTETFITVSDFNTHIKESLDYIPELNLENVKYHYNLIENINKNDITDFKYSFSTDSDKDFNLQTEYALLLMDYLVNSPTFTKK